MFYVFQILIYLGVIATPNRLFRPPFQRWLSTSSGAVQGRVALGSALSFVSFSLGLFLQRKAAKDFWYQDLLDAFSFATRGTKEKALQKENAVFCARAAQAPLLKKWTKQSVGFVRTKCEINHNLYEIFSLHMNIIK